MRRSAGRFRRRPAAHALVLFAAALVAGCATPRTVPPAATHGNATARTLARGSSSWDGQALPAYPAGTPEITVLHITIPPGTALPLHRHPVINAGVLLKGELTVVKDDGATLRLKPGDALIELVHAWHFGRNDGAVPAEIVVFYAGTAGAPVSEYPPSPPP